MSLFLELAVAAYGLALLAFEHAHNTGALSFDAYRMWWRTIFAPLLWMIDIGCCDWLIPLLTFPC